MTAKRFISECTECKYFIDNRDGTRCLMKQEFCIVGGKTSYPKNCQYFEGDKE